VSIDPRLWFSHALPYASEWDHARFGSLVLPALLHCTQFPPWTSTSRHYKGVERNLLCALPWVLVSCESTEQVPKNSNLQAVQTTPHLIVKTMGCMRRKHSKDNLLSMTEFNKSMLRWLVWWARPLAPWLCSLGFQHSGKGWALVRKTG
jgi:hypothetical protein